MAENMIGFDKISRDKLIYYLITTETYTLRLLIDSSNSRALQIIILQALTILFFVDDICGFTTTVMKLMENIHCV